MTRREREQMVLGEEYDSRDPELLAMAHRARGLLASFSSFASTDAEARRAILVELLGEVGAGVWVEPPFFCDYGAQITIGANTFVNTGCVFLDSATIRVGADSLLGPGVQLLTVAHPVRAAERIVPAAERGAGRAPYRTFARPIEIGARTWIGAGTIVLPGVTIGDDATIGAGSIVTTDIPAGTLALGRPCRVRREL